MFCSFSADQNVRLNITRILVFLQLFFIFVFVVVTVHPLFRLNMVSLKVMFRLLFVFGLNMVTCHKKKYSSSFFCVLFRKKALRKDRSDFLLQSSKMSIVGHGHCRCCIAAAAAVAAATAAEAQPTPIPKEKLRCNTPFPSSFPQRSTRVWMGATAVANVR